MLSTGHTNSSRYIYDIHHLRVSTGARSKVWWATTKRPSRRSSRRWEEARSRGWTVRTCGWTFGNVNWKCPPNYLYWSRARRGRSILETTRLFDRLIWRFFQVQVWDGGDDVKLAEESKKEQPKTVCTGCDPIIITDIQVYSEVKYWLSLHSLNLNSGTPRSSSSRSFWSRIVWRHREHGGELEVI